MVSYRWLSFTNTIRYRIFFDYKTIFPRNGCCFHSIPHRDVGHAFSVTLSDQDPKSRTLKWLFLVRSRAEEKAVMVFGSFYSFYCVFTPRGCRFPFCGLLCQVIFQVLEFQSGLMNDELISGEMSQNHWKRARSAEDIFRQKTRYL